MIDIDHFKTVNDTYGHAAGDEAIVFLSTLLKRFFADKITARFGGEEFVVVIEDLNLAAMHGIMNDFRLAVALSSVALPNELALTLTVSIGFAVGKAQDIANLLKVADDGLYVAKRNGRNQIFSTQSLEQVRIEGQPSA
jgi:diguanylate cyclase